MRQFFIERPSKLEYWRIGDRPRWLVHSGMHGDEHGVIEPLRRVLERREAELPDLVWVPAASPSAVAARQRVNAAGLDLNRAFAAEPANAEAKALLAAMDGRVFDLFVSFHEDPTTDRFYLYDEAQDASGTPELAGLFAKVKSLGVRLYEGLDDPEDPVLGNVVDNGYFSGLWRPPRSGGPAADGTIEGYLARHGLARRILTPEVPTLVPAATKEAIVDAVIDYLLTLK